MKRIVLLSIIIIALSCGVRNHNNGASLLYICETDGLFCDSIIQDSLDLFLLECRNKNKSTISILVSISLEKGDTVLVLREQYPPFVNSPFEDPLSVTRGSFAKDDVVFHIVYHDFVNNVPFIREDLIEFEDTNSRPETRSDIYLEAPFVPQKVYTYHNGALTIR